jgi:hypothetical protein
MCRPSASGVHATCGDYRSVGIERIIIKKVIGGKKVITWRHPLYKRWNTILRRAAWKSHSDMAYKKTGPYYAKCTVCDEWLDFSNFARWALEKGYRRELQIDRIDNERGYSPDNCRWVTPSEQARNRRMTEKWRRAMKRIGILSRIAQAAAGYPNLAKGRAVQAARRAAANAAIEGSIV